jgi:Fibronectin type III domain
MDASAGLIITAVLAGLLCLRRRRPASPSAKPGRALSDEQMMDAKAAGYAKRWEKNQRPRQVGTATVLVLGFLLCGAQAASVKLFWKANPERDKVSMYEVEVKEVLGAESFTVRTDGTETLVTGLRHGGMYFFRLRAMNAGGWSDYNEALLAEASERFRVTIQVSDSLGAWTDTHAVKVVKAAGKGFFRGKVENIEGGGL